MTISPARRAEVIDALRRGTVPQAGLDLLAVGLDRFERAIDDELDSVAAGGAAFKAVRGEYGAGKTFFARWLAERAKRRGMAAAEVQISETETPLHKLETVYRRLVEQLSHRRRSRRARCATIVDAWFFTLEEDVARRRHRDRRRRAKPLAEARRRAAGAAAGRRRRAPRPPSPPPCAPTGRPTLRRRPGHRAGADRLARRPAARRRRRQARAPGVRGDLDHFGALGFLQGLLDVLRDSGHPGLLLVLDEVETLQRVRGPTSATRPSTRCGSCSTRSTPAGSRACTW